MLHTTHLMRCVGAALLLSSATLLSTTAHAQVYGSQALGSQAMGSQILSSEVLNSESLATAEDSGTAHVTRVALADRDANSDTTADLPANLRRQTVPYTTSEPAGTIVIDTPNTYLYYVLGGGKAIRYGIGIGRDGFTWSGVKTIERKSEWPDWIPPADMLHRQPYLPRFMAGGPGNPLGARAMYLGGTVYRIHGTNAPATIGKRVSSGCIRLSNADVVDLYNLTHVGTKVVVLPMHDATIAKRLPAMSHHAEGFFASQIY